MGRRGAAPLCIVAATAVATVALASDVADNDSRRAEPREAARPLALRPLMPAAGRILRNRAHSVRVTVPPAWDHSAESLTPQLAQPGPVLAVATFPLRADPRRACGSGPDMPQAGIGPRDALIHVMEELDAQPGRRPARPRRFTLLQQVRRPSPNDRLSVFPWRCLDRVGIVGLRSSFRAHGRLLHVTAVAGERTSRRQRRELLGVLQSLRFGPPRPVAVRVLPRYGHPDTRFRLELVATHRSGRLGRRERGYWAAVHGPQGIACVIENHAWFSDGPPGARVQAVLDPSRTKGQRWCRGRFKGVVRYRDAVCRRRGRCNRAYLRSAGHFRFTVR